MKIELMLFIERVSYFHMPLSILTDAFILSVTKSWFSYYFNKNTDLDYVGPILDVSYFWTNEMSISERREFMTRYNDQNNKVFDDKLALEKYCQIDVQPDTSVPDF